MLNIAQHFVLALLASAATLANAQSLADLPMLPSWPGISTSCYNALNTTVNNCPGFLGSLSVRNERLNSTQVQSLCSSQCLSSLQSVRTTIQNGCKNATTDVIEYFDGNTYPATYIADRWIYTYNLACRKDKATGNFCDPMLITWLKQTTAFTSAQNCSDCILGSYQTQLNSPFDFDTILERNFKNLTSSCSATGYAYTTPAKYALSTSTSATVSATTTSGTASNPACTKTYTVHSGDTCNSIARAQNVSTYSVIYAGSLDVACSNLLAGQSLCLGGQQCTTYIVQEKDTCASILAAQSGITGSQLLAWNPNINSLCGNLYDLTGRYICISNPGGPLGTVTVSTPLAVSTPSTAAPKPTNAPKESNSNCGTWYTVQDGDYCDKLSIRFGISLKDFYFLNPEINNPNCTNLLLGLSYCVEAVGNIETYSGYPTTSKFYTLTSATYSTTPANTVTRQTVPATTTSRLPVASGTESNCTDYINYVNVPGIIDQSQSPDRSPLTPYINNCSFLIDTYKLSFNDLINWNPSLKPDIYNCNLQPGLSYCISMGAPAANDTETPNCLPVDSTTIRNSTISSCSCFTQVYANQNGTFGCVDMADWYSITVDQITKWNPWVGSNCDTGIFAGAKNATYYNAVCIGTNSTAPTTTGGSGPPTTTKPGQTMGPTQTGIISSCTQYYTVQSGDSCASVDAMFGISFAQFYSWNPAVGSDCQSLYAGYSYCVAAPSSSTTTTNAPAPTQSGTASGCSTYYTVQNGDSCSSIQSMFNITFATLYKWNPGIGSNCQSLWVGYGVCVAGGPP